jgi:hypothetical protein
LNIPEHEDHLKLYPNITRELKYSDFTEDEINKIRQSKGIIQPNLLTGERPKSIVEQGNLLTKLVGKTRKRSKYNKKHTKNC